MNTYIHYYGTKQSMQLSVDSLIVCANRMEAVVVLIETVGLADAVISSTQSATTDTETPVIFCQLIIFCAVLCQTRLVPGWVTTFGRVNHVGL